MRSPPNENCHDFGGSDWVELLEKFTTEQTPRKEMDYNK
jgi:hypothetical protein